MHRGESAAAIRQFAEAVRLDAGYREAEANLRKALLVQQRGAPVESERQGTRE